MSKSYGMKLRNIMEWNVKISWNAIEDAAQNLIKIRDNIKENNGKPPKVLCVICGLSNVAYQRPDGVYVIPLTALKP